jgi:hypothetical protein
VAGRLVGAVRRHFRKHGSDQDKEALANLEAAPASLKRLQALASAIDAHARADGSWREELQALIEETKSGGVYVGTLTQSAWGDHNIQIGGVAAEITRRSEQPPRQQLFPHPFKMVYLQEPAVPRH